MGLELRTGFRRGLGPKKSHLVFPSFQVRTPCSGVSSFCTAETLRQWFQHHPWTNILFPPQNCIFYSWVGWRSSQLMDLAAKAITVSIIENPVIPGSYQVNAEAFLGSKPNHLLDLNGNILMWRVRGKYPLVEEDRMVQVRMPTGSDKVLCYLGIWRTSAWAQADHIRIFDLQNPETSSSPRGSAWIWSHGVFQKWQEENLPTWDETRFRSPWGSILTDPRSPAPPCIGHLIKGFFLDGNLGFGYIS